MQLSSPQNPFLKKVRQAAEAGRNLESGLVVAEGPHLVGEALDSEWAIHQVLATPASRQRFPGLFERIDRRSNIECMEVAERAFERASTTEHTQGVLALLRPRQWSWVDLMGESPLVILEAIQDPGNAGTIIRSAEAFGAAGVVLLEGSVRSANGKLLRASAGSVFRLPFLEGVSLTELIEETRLAQIKMYGLTAKAQTSLTSMPLGGRFALVVGSEGAGISPELMAWAEPVSIPTAKVESLNAAVACSLALFEAARQRGEQTRKPV